MYAGRVVETASAGQLVRAPRHPYTRDLIASAPDVDAPQAHRFRTIPGQPPQPAALPQGCPYHLRCSRAQDVCRQEEPPAVVGGTLAACWFAEEDMADAQQ
jgi:oligopeptide/dipeptide ABC transporter ATP-binding protein